MVIPSASSLTSLEGQGTRVDFVIGLFPKKLERISRTRLRGKK
jgi:hypothetical protein